MVPGWLLPTVRGAKFLPMKMLTVSSANLYRNDLYSSPQLREAQSEKPNPQPLPYKGRGVRIKASLSQKSYPLPSQE
jgi:hypothetical protein